MQGLRFWQNLWFALLLFLLLSAAVKVDLPAANQLEEYLEFVLTTDYDFSRFIAPLRESLQNISLTQVGATFRQMWGRFQATVSPSSPAADLPAD